MGDLETVPGNLGLMQVLMQKVEKMRETNKT